METPNEFFARMIEVQSNSGVLLVDGFRSSELELFDQVFVRSLGESLSFFRVKIDVVDEKRGFSELESSWGVSTTNTEQVRSLLKFEVDSDVVILYLTYFLIYI